MLHDTGYRLIVHVLASEAGDDVVDGHVVVEPDLLCKDPAGAEGAVAVEYDDLLALQV